MFIIYLSLKILCYNSIDVNRIFLPNPIMFIILLSTVLVNEQSYCSKSLSIPQYDHPLLGDTMRKSSISLFLDLKFNLKHILYR